MARALRVEEWSGSGVFTVSWWVVLQWHFDIGPRRVAAFSVWCGLPFLVPYKRGATLSSDDFMCVRLSQVVVVWRGVEFEFAAGLFSV